MRDMRGSSLCFREWKRKGGGRESEEGGKKIWEKRKEKDVRWEVKEEGRK